MGDAHCPLDFDSVARVQVCVAVSCCQSALLLSVLAVLVGLV